MPDLTPTAVYRIPKTHSEWVERDRDSFVEFMSEFNFAVRPWLAAYVNRHEDLRLLVRDGRTVAAFADDGPELLDLEPAYVSSLLRSAERLGRRAR